MAAATRLPEEPASEINSTRPPKRGPAKAVRSTSGTRVDTRFSPIHGGSCDGVGGRAREGEGGCQTHCVMSMQMPIMREKTGAQARERVNGAALQNAFRQFTSRPEKFSNKAGLGAKQGEGA